MFVRLYQRYQQVKLKTWVLYLCVLEGIVLLPSKVFANWETGLNISASQLQSTTTQQMSKGMSVGFIVVGSFILMAAGSVLIKVLSTSAEERGENSSRSHSNTIITLIIALLVVIIGLAMMAVGLKGLTSIPSN